MTGYHRLLATMLLSALSTAAVAEDYKTPANMTAEDRQMLLSEGRGYENCVQRQFKKLAPEVGDPRALTDAAMAACQSELTAFAETMASENYHPDYSNYYIEKLKRRVANETVRQAMFIMSQRQNRQEPQTQSE